MYSLLKTYYTRVAYSAYDSKNDSKTDPSPSNKSDPSTSNVNVKYHDQCTFTCVFTMLPYPDGQT